MSIFSSSVVVVLSVILNSSCLAAGPQAASQPQTAATEQQPKLVVLTELVEKPAAYIGQSIRVRGTLKNAGTNYFTNRRIVLTDGKGHSLDVRPWLPLSRPGPSSRTRSGPTLADYLDQHVEIVGSLERRSEADRQGEYILQVTSAEVRDI